MNSEGFETYVLYAHQAVYVCLKGRCIAILNTSVDARHLGASLSEQ